MASPPRFEFDPTWPKPLPAGWITGVVRRRKQLGTAGASVSVRRELNLLPVPSNVVNRSVGETATTVMRGHADLLMTSISTSVPPISAGPARGLAVSSTQRLGGALAETSSWNELGFPSSSSWKGIMVPKGITLAQIAYWDDAIRKTAQNDEQRRDRNRKMDG